MQAVAKLHKENPRARQIHRDLLGLQGNYNTQAALLWEDLKASRPIPPYSVDDINDATIL